MKRSNPNQSSLFGYYHPITGDVTAHPPLCACGKCGVPLAMDPAKHDWDLKITRPSPSFNQDIFTLRNLTYTEAVSVAENGYITERRHVSLTNHGQTYVWHSISAAGESRDYNTNSGVPRFRRFQGSVWTEESERSEQKKS